MNTIYICSLNTSGLKKRIKYRTILKELGAKKFNVISLQESYLTSQELNIIQKEMGGMIHMSTTSGRSVGLVTFFSKIIESEKVVLIYKTDRIIISKVLFNNHSIYIINIYSPCNNNEKVTFINIKNN